ncbi:MAG: ribose-phosphate diphosphokinase [Clostridiales bacterium]|jgi:ribose-phosphate pyrophosphokinase|nr:ribose-phosphate diphosphokinase [Clostridiales bacterium]
MSRSRENLCLVALPGTEEFSASVDFYLKKWHDTDHTFIMDTACPRFLTGDSKAIMLESVRAKDVYIISDPYNYSVSYKMRGHVNHMSPDDHFQNIKRVISAINGKARRISVMMNMLYGSRQHGRSMRESLDCAMSLRELEYAGVKNVITFDAHDPEVQNSVPLMSFDNLYPSYQMLKALLRNERGIDLHREATVIVSPDDGGVQRCIQFAKSLNLEIGMFYKQRNTNVVQDGNVPIERHEYIGNDIAGRDVIIVDDILATGDSLIDSFRKLKQFGARKLYAFITFGMFTRGSEAFDRAYEEGVFDRIFVTNLTYHQVDGAEKPYLCIVDLSKYAAYVINCIFQEISISEVLDPETKISQLMKLTGGKS